MDGLFVVLRDDEADRSQGPLRHRLWQGPRPDRPGGSQESRSRRPIGEIEATKPMLVDAQFCAPGPETSFRLIEKRRAPGCFRKNFRDKGPSGYALGLAQAGIYCKYDAGARSIVTHAASRKAG